jgi:hypothetical protein
VWSGFAADDCIWFVVIVFSWLSFWRLTQLAASLAARFSAKRPTLNKDTLLEGLQRDDAGDGEEHQPPA